MTQDKTLNEWIAMYEAKTGKKFERQPGFQFYYFPERGFAEITADVKNQIVIVYQLCGDGHFWRRLIEFLAQSLRFKCAGTFCIRHIKPYIRFWGFRIERVETTPEGLERYFCKDKYGTNLTCSPAWQDDKTGEWAYYMTWEVR